MESIIMIVAMFALLYFLMIRPENKRKKKAQEMRDGLKKGDTITTIGGIIGKVVSVGNDTFVIETSEDRVRIEFAKWALSTVGVQTSEQPVEERSLRRRLLRFPRNPWMRFPLRLRKNKSVFIINRTSLGICSSNERVAREVFL